MLANSMLVKQRACATFKSALVRPCRWHHRLHEHVHWVSRAAASGLEPKSARDNITGTYSRLQVTASRWASSGWLGTGHGGPASCALRALSAQRASPCVRGTRMCERAPCSDDETS